MQAEHLIEVNGERPEYVKRNLRFNFFIQRGYMQPWTKKLRGRFLTINPFLFGYSPLLSGGSSLAKTLRKIKLFACFGHYGFAQTRTTKKDSGMKIVVRKYSGAGAVELFDLLEQHATEVQSLLGSVRGLIDYTLNRTDGGGFTVTVCEDQAGIDESTEKARDWVASNGSHLGVSAPEVFDGSVLFRVKR